MLAKASDSDVAGKLLQIFTTRVQRKYFQTSTRDTNNLGYKYAQQNVYERW